MKTYVLNEVCGKMQGEMIIVEAESAREACEKAGMTDIIKPYDTFKTYGGKMYEVHEQGQSWNVELICREMTFKNLREKSGMNLTEFSKFFDIPYRTVQNWESGVNVCAPYIIKLIEFRLEHKDK